MYGLGIRFVYQNHCGASVGNTEITDLVFPEIFQESLKILVIALEALHEEAKPLGLQLFCTKTKVHA